MRRLSLCSLSFLDLLAHYTVNKETYDDEKDNQADWTGHKNHIAALGKHKRLPEIAL